MVGTSGSAGERFTANTESARRLPAFTCGTAGASVVNMIGVWPATVDWIAGPAPGNGTCTMSTPVTSRNRSPERCGVVPTPAWAKLLYLQGLAFITATNSLTVFAGTVGCTITTLAISPTIVSGMKSL